MNRRGRYAPSPSGDLHLGNLRTALVAWLFARSQGAEFLLRIEDLDPDRSRPEIAERQLADLRTLGIDWDGPDPPMRQSRRSAAYAAALAELEAQGLIYECFCTRAEIREAASAPHGALAEGHYPGTCRGLTETERAQRRRSGRPAALRVRADAAQIGFSDRLGGERTGVVDDFVVRRNDGTHGYNLAVVVDDVAQGIGEVVRGRDLLDSTARQIWLARTLGLEPIGSWAHVPLVLTSDGRRLAKRSGSATLRGRLEAGGSAAETLALIASSLGICERDERPTAARLIADFDPGALPLDDAPLPGAGGAPIESER